jgi:hypothetical protein
VSEVDDVLPAGPGLRIRWLIAAPCVLAGAVLPLVIANVLAVWQNSVTRDLPLAEVLHDFAPGIALWTAVPAVFGIIVLILNRFAVTAWPGIITGMTVPALLAFAIVGPVSGQVSANHRQPWYFLDIPGAVALGIGGYLLVRFGVRRLAEPAALDNLASRLDVRVPRHRGGAVLLRHDRLVIIGTDGRRTVRRAYSWYDFRFVPAKQTSDGELEVVAAGERYAFPVDPLEAPVIRAAIRARAQHVRVEPGFEPERSAHRREHPGRSRTARKTVNALTSQELSRNLTPGFMLLVYIFMVVGPVGAVVGIIGLTQASPDNRTELILVVVADVVLGTLAHLKFWRLRAARRYLETHSDS